MINKSKAKLSTALATCLVCLLLSACGGSGGGSTTSTATTPTAGPPALDPATTSINGISVPVAPNLALASATVAGVDTNSNGVRDEVDRAVALSYGSTPTEHAAAIAYAAKTQVWLTNDSSTENLARATIVRELEAFECLRSQVGSDAARIIAQEVEIRTFNTRLRMLERQRVQQAAGVFVLPAIGSGSC